MLGRAILRWVRPKGALWPLIFFGRSWRKQQSVQELLAHKVF
jgi:hypothetical protein